MKYTILLLAAVAIPNLIASHDGKQVRSNQAKIYLGKTATICGTVVTYDCRESDRTTSLDLDKPYWRKGVAVEISEATRARIGPRLEDEYLQREICATGVVERRNGRYLVMLQDPSQIRVEKPSATQLSALLPDAARFWDGSVVQPTVVSLKRPVYTRAAFDAKVEGKVFLEAVVMVDGTVGPARVIYSEFDPKLGLEAQALAAARASQFRAGKVAGRPAPVIVTIEQLSVLR